MACKSGTLYTYPQNFRAQKCLITAKYSKVDLKIAPDFVFGESNTEASFLKKFPSGKVPAFESSEGVTLTESNAIAYFIASEELRGKTPVERAQIQQWLDFTDSNILPPALTWVFPCLGAMAYNKKSMDRAKEDVGKALKVLNDHFLLHTYLVGERISLADISLTCSILSLYVHVMDPEFRKPFPNVERWFNTMINQVHVKEVLGTVTLCKKVALADGKKFNELMKNSNTAAESVKKAKAPAAAAAPPSEEAPPAMPKPKDPFEKIPSGSFDMDDFKRFYSNNDEVQSVPYFWEKFDKEHYSIWRCDYKYADELTMVFMSCNLIGGMFQRLDKLRKNAFASVCLFGENNNSTISGIWVWKGHDLAFELSDDWKIDYSSYNWTKLDADSGETKDLVEQYFKWEGADKEGKKFNQGKIFK
ncbi:elongation factor 1-gamma [Lepeophtheirus salmonis]|uniref:elongation factor 1-gamma n=1 Tax=Lepeophtheirus salmonis TaxID=72036 RepID=UPI001AE68064|nr:elongation factor 1-gamma-like [Lepeophtheirus salmonis]